MMLGSMEMAIGNKIQLFIDHTSCCNCLRDDRIKLDLFAPREWDDETSVLFLFKILSFYWFNTEEDGYNFCCFLFAVKLV